MPNPIEQVYRRCIWRIIRAMRQTVTIPTRQGVFTVSCRDRVIAKRLYCEREFELELMQKAVQSLDGVGTFSANGKGTVLDVGANIGVTSIGLLSHRFFQKAIAIEPDPFNYSLLERNVRQNNMADSILCLPCALSDETGTVPLELSELNFGDHRIRAKHQSRAPQLNRESERRVIQVPCRRLDDLAGELPPNALEELALVWVDVQGHEYNVFRGGRRLLSKGLPVVCEISPYLIKRSGTTFKEFAEIAAELWSHYSVLRKRRFLRYPISLLHLLWEELGDEGGYTNVIFTK